MCRMKSLRNSSTKVDTMAEILPQELMTGLKGYMVCCPRCFDSL